ncbi:MAG: sigma-70 family RNA polymerase sigma factor [Anaeromicrobium sp.]|jgi:RNA polymerase sigma factor (sigma-70 family)|uniref:RNA polymerase sigma factor n=1 Tax=Anaeromicrobium sp. TaxID=1929132 RepID=UPI0025FFA026|nr:sigma-70 family RNA polymerase sigma factor [Anaeromicrobium sp.]MCT4593631.1 sigma-70 family RNA polymerase sigma factor [Anaeromicrobium sp.]
MYSEIVNLIHKIKSGNNESLVELIKIFKPLIRKFSYKLNYDCAETDIQIFLITLFRKFPIEDTNENLVLAYIKNCVYNEYIRLSKKYGKINSRELVGFEQDMSTISSEGFEDNVNASIVIKDLMENLSEREETIIKSIYFDNLTQVELADKLGVTKQYINKAKKNILKKLKNMYIEKNTRHMGRRI